MYHQTRTHWIYTEQLLLIALCHSNSILPILFADFIATASATSDVVDGLIYRFDMAPQFNGHLLQNLKEKRKRKYIFILDVEFVAPVKSFMKWLKCPSSLAVQ